MKQEIFFSVISFNCGGRLSQSSLFSCWSGTVFKIKWINLLSDKVFECKFNLTFIKQKRINNIYSGVDFLPFLWPKAQMSQAKSDRLRHKAVWLELTVITEGFLQTCLQHVFWCQFDPFLSDIKKRVIYMEKVELMTFYHMILCFIWASR